MIKYYITTIVALLLCCSANSQNLAVKTNLLYDATATVNLGLEIGLGKRTTIDLSGNYNGWDMNKETNKKMRHYLVQPEFRYYFCEKLNGHFLGLHGLFSEYNVSGGNWLLGAMGTLSTLNGANLKDFRYEGYGYGVGISYGYDIMLSSRFNLELTVGVGYIHFDYDKYGAPKCAPLIESANSNYFGLTKLGVSLVYIIK